MVLKYNVLYLNRNENRKECLLTCKFNQIQELCDQFSDGPVVIISVYDARDCDAAEKQILKDKIIYEISHSVDKFLCYDRREDSDLSEEDLHGAIEDGIITVDEIVSEFRVNLETSLKELTQ